MSYQIKLASAVYPLVFLMVDSTDHITGKTGLSPTVTLSKSSAAFAAPAGAVAEIGVGWYVVAGNATDSATLGPLILHATAVGADPVDILYEVVAYDPQDAVRLGLTALPNAAAEAAGGLFTRGTGAGQINQDANGRIDTNTATWNALATVALPLIPTTAGRTLDVSATGEAGVDWANVGAPTTTNNLSGTTVAAVSGAVGSVTGNVGGNVTGSVGSVVGLTAANLDVAVSSRLAPTTASRTLDVAATGEAGLDFDNVKQATGATTLTNIRVPNVTLTDTVTTYAGNTVQTGDSYARIGAAGVGLTAVSLSAAGIQAIWDALTSALTTAGSVGKWIVDKLDVVVSTRLATSGYAAPLDAAGTRAAVGLASANLDTQIAAVQSDTDNIQTRIPAALTSDGNMKADTLRLSGDATSASNLAAFYDAAIILGSITAAAPTSSNFSDSTKSATDEFYKGCVLVFRSGALAGIPRKITAYAGATGTFTFATAFPVAPAQTDTFAILGRIE